MLYQILTFLVLIQIKHLGIDFYSQDMDQVKGKGIYGNWIGFTHSLEHAMATLMVVSWCNLCFNVNPLAYLLLPLIDLVTHYHIDWIKMNWGNRDMTNTKFWHHLGLDQFAHQIVYIILTAILFNQ